MHYAADKYQTIKFRDKTLILKQKGGGGRLQENLPLIVSAKRFSHTQIPMMYVDGL